MIISLRNRMLLLALAPATVVALLLCAVFVLYSIDNLEQGLHTRGAALSRQISAAAEYGIFSGQRESLSVLTTSVLRIDPDARAAAILDAQGTVMAQSGDLHPRLWSGLAKSQALRLERDALLFIEPVTRSTLPVDDIYAGTETRDVGEPKVIGHVVVKMAIGEVSRKSLWLMSIAVAFAMFAVALGAWLAMRISHTVAVPLLKATEVVGLIGQGDLTVRMATESAGALQSLAAGINDMAGRIGVTQENLREQVAVATLDLQREKDAAERATIAKSQFLAAASHDLRQPLHALGLFVSGLAQSEAAKQEPKLVENIKESVSALQNLLIAILDVSRLDHGNLVPQIGNLALADVMDHLASSFSHSAEQKGLSFRIRPTRIWVRSDPKIVERILLNLISNALRYTRAGGVLVGCRRRREAVVIEVWDTGGGIPDNAHAEIFEDYVQLANSERDRAKGLGLGLAICRRLAALLEVRIGVRSRLGRGSVFWIELPLVPPELLGSEPTGEVSPVVETADFARLAGTILVVESDALVRAAMEQAITGWGGNVLLAANGKQALHHCRESDRIPDVTICNIRLPGRGSGIELVEELQREFEGMSFLLVSADSSEAAKEAASKAGLVLLKKPLPPARLRAALQQLLAARA